jgi:transcriptional regulator with XRE-family HTH domain
MTEHSSEPPVKRTLGATIHAYRLRAGMSQRKLASLAGCDFSYLARLERGENDRPSPPVLLGIAKALNLEPDKLLRFIGVKPRTVMTKPRTYFRKAYDLTPEQANEAAERMEQIVRELRNHHDKNKKR